MDLAVSISQLQEGRSGEKEKTRVINQIRDQVLLRYENAATVTTTGNGVYATIWSATMPKNSSWYIDTITIGRGVTSGCAIEQCVGLQDFAGVASVIGGTAQVTFTRVDVAGMDVKFTLVGDVITLQVRDDGAQAMHWKSFIVAQGVS
jgi:hypothetical protein